MRLELDRFKSALEHFGFPERHLKIVHIAGTNGKGSTSATLASCLHLAGGCKNVGLYTSPHLHRVNERIQINGAPIADEALVHWVNELKSKQEHLPPLTFFETMTLIAFCHFKTEACDMVVLETGLGGTWDATNAVEKPVLTAITTIAMDHQAYLGDSIIAIAKEKCGIMKPGVPCVVSQSNEHLASLFEQESSAHSTTCSFASSFSELNPALMGKHQKDNLNTSLTCFFKLAELQHITPNQDLLQSAIDACVWPGRLEWIGNVLLDAAHNPSGALALVDAIQSLPEKPALAFGVMADKEHSEMIRILAPHVSRAFLLRPWMDRAADPELLKQTFEALRVEAFIFETPDALCKHLNDDSRQTTVVTGSIFFMSEIRCRLLGIEAHPTLRM